MVMQRKSTQSAIRYPSNQSGEQDSPGRSRRILVRFAAAAAFLLFIMLSQPDAFSGAVFNHTPGWVRWSLLVLIGWYGWWETSLYLKKSLRDARPEEPSNANRGLVGNPNQPRIRLLPHTPEHLRALLDGVATYESRFQIKVADGVRDFLAGPEVSAEFLARLKGLVTSDPWQDGFGVLHLADNVVIGMCGFTGPPTQEGTVEIAYGIAPAYQNRGHAVEVAQELIAYALADDRVRTIQAHTLPESNASTRVLTKCGFARVGETTHPTDGVVWRWEMRRREISDISLPTAERRIETPVRKSAA